MARHEALRKRSPPPTPREQLLRLSPVLPRHRRLHRNGRRWPHARTDYHINSTPEFFYQHRGAMLLKTVDNSTTPPTFQDIPIHEGSLFLLPANTPHCPVRFADTVGIVVEMPRGEGAEDAMRWYCSGCKGVVWEKRFVCTDLGTQVKEVVEEFTADEGKRKCGGCGKVAAVRYAEGELVQPGTFPE
ncbi:3-hydroxyanthranilate 3,4-dioxygenase 1 [Emergomyces africanus]|uniref:3-hydroxyanthranilate 3,4-dioxygenase 1 n=1 Tax=Emergomyces africanus TaxID=1955775 RepID=A0A1B7NU36_9EURO|nr:3-hydroxyanthranilate 3,4-dioxygenase 1 [Emergomyces africanus]